MENTKRTQRTPSEIIAETEARLERLRVRQAKAQAQSNPAIASLMDEKADLAKSLREAKKLLGAGPQSAEARIAKHEVWIGKIQIEAAQAEDMVATVSDEIETTDAKIAAAITEFVKSEKSAQA